MRFIEIKNTSQKSIRIKNINYKMVDCEPYQLNVVDSRTSLFKTATKITQDINLDLKPNQNLFLLTEFGFDTKIHAQSSINYVHKNSEKILNETENQKIFIYRQHEKSVWSEESENNLLIRYTNYSEEEDLKNEQPLYDVTLLNEDFLGRTKTLEDLMSKKPRRFAVGSILDIVSIECDGETVLIDPPKDLDAFYISQYFACGSCPYLLAYDKDKKYWIEIGTVLYGRDNETFNDFEIYSISSSISKIRIEERDPEITYIHHLSILIYSKNCDSPEREIFPDLSGSFNQCSNYFSLSKGDYVEFNIPSGDEFDFKLKLKGYYEILSLLEV